MATKNTILGTVPKSRGRYTEGDTTTKWYYDNILEYKGSSFRCISEESTGITGAPATYNSGTHTLVPNTGWEFFVDTTGALDVEERLAENEEKLSELETEVIYDVTANNNGMTFASLSTLLLSDNLSTLIPVSVRCGGMNIRFIQTSDNKYIQARCMAQNFTTDITQWQGIDDEPNAGSDNLVKSSGVAASVLDKIIENSFINIFNPDDINTLVGKYLEYTGEVIDNAGYVVSGYIKAKPNTTYYNAGVNAFRSAASFDKDFNMIDYLDQATLSYTTPNNQSVKYIRVNFFIGEYNTAQVSEQNTGYHKFNPITGYLIDNEDLLQSNAVGDVIGTLFHTAGIRENYQGIVFGSEYKNGILEKDTFMNDDGSFTPSNNYFVYKFQLAAGKYWIKTCFNYTHATFAKYTDDTYTSAETVEFRDIDDIRELAAGYYAICSHIGYNNVPQFIFNTKSFDKVLSCSPSTSINIWNSPIESGKCIMETDGSIVDGDVVYKLMKFRLYEDGYYHIGKNISNGHAVLAKYTDSTYNTLDKIIIYTGYLISIDGDYYLESGYYALCGVYNGESELEVTKLRPSTKTVISSEFARKQNFAGGFQNFIEFAEPTGGAKWNRISDNIVESNGIGELNRLRSPFTYLDTYLCSVTATPTEVDGNGNFEVAFGKYPDEGLFLGIGTLVKIGKNGNGKYIEIGNVDDQYAYHQVSTWDASSLRMGVGKSLSIKLYKCQSEETYMKLVVTDCSGTEIVKDNLPTWQDINDTISIKYGYGLGRVIMYSISGKWQFKQMSYGSEVDVNDIKLVIIGHSLVEGENTTLFHKDKRFAEMLLQDIGENNVMIMAKGGERISIADIVIPQIRKYPSTRYALIFLGENEPLDDYDTIQRFELMNQNLNGMGIKTIWATQHPDINGVISHPNIDAYIRANFDYIDVAQVFYDDNGNIDTSMYGDEVHPSIAGHQRIFNLIKAQCSQFWEI